MGRAVKAVVLISLTLLIGISAAQTKQNLLVINPLGLMLGTLYFNYEHGTAGKAALGFGGNYTNISYGTNSVSGFGIEGTYTAYSNELFRGWFFKPGVGISFLNVTYVDDYGYKQSGSGAGFAAGAFGGYRWTWDSFSMGLGGGVVISTGNIEGYTFSRVGPSILFDMGFAF